MLGLRFCSRAFSSCGKWGPLFIAVRGPLLLRSTGSRHARSVVVAHGPSRSAACGIFPDQGLNPCPLHWQADSQPLRHQGSPIPSSSLPSMLCNGLQNISLLVTSGFLHVGSDKILSKFLNLIGLCFFICHMGIMYSYT